MKVFASSVLVVQGAGTVNFKVLDLSIKSVKVFFAHGKWAAAGFIQKI